MKENKTLLFVDDEEEILDILVDFFSDNGYELHTATSANDAIRIMDERTVDFVLSDLKLPDRSGSELLDEIKDKTPNTVRVLTSGYLDVQFGRVAESKKDGTLYLSKPWDLLTLRNLVTQRLGN